MPAKDIAKRIRWGEAAVSAVVGYLAPNAALATGVPQYLFATNPTYAKFVHAADPYFEGGSSYGVKPIAKGGALAALLKMGHYYTKTGKISDGKLNVAVPFAIGVTLDDVGDPSGMGFAGSGGVSW
jgi:hypothetical protein